MISTKRLLFIILLVVTCAQSYAEDFSFSMLTNIFGKYYVKKENTPVLNKMLADAIYKAASDQCPDIKLTQSDNAQTMWNTAKSLCPKMKSVDAIALVGSVLPQFDPDTYVVSDKIADGGLAGVGTELRDINGDAVISKIYTDSPADRSALRPGMIIRTVDGKKVSSLDETVSLMRGNRGTQVTVTDDKGHEYKLVRDIISVKPCKLIEYKNKIVLIRIDVFRPDFSKKIIDILKKYPENRGVVLDIRGCNGGNLKEISNTAGLFTDKREMFIINDENGIDIYKKTTEQLIKSPVVIITDRFTISGGTLFAKIMQSAGAKVIGMKTMPVGKITKSLYLDDNNYLVVPTGKIDAADHKPLSDSAIEPDIKTDISDDIYEKAEKLISGL